jgi:adenylate cyclase class 2
VKVEIEIKLRLTGDLAAVRKKLRALGFHMHRRRTLESNVLLDNRKNALRKNGTLLRVRRTGSAALLTFKGPSQPGRYKKRVEVETPVPDAAVMETILAEVGYHPVFRYEKFRTEYEARSGGGKILLDETPIGNFLELEGSPRWIDQTSRRLGFSTGDYINRSYGYLYLAYCRERRIRPKDMVFKHTR